MLHYYAIVFLPLVAAILSGFIFASADRKWSQLITVACVTSAAILSWIIFYQLVFGTEQASSQVITTIELMRWFGANSIGVNWALRFDALSIVMCMVINSISAMVHIYSIGYMQHDSHVPRFMTYLSFFTFAMLMLVTADNLIQLFFGWEGVGLASYLLIGFWFEKESANRAAIKAFIVNRFGDLAFALGLALIFVSFNSLNFDEIFALAPYYSNDTFSILNYEVNLITLICVLLFIGAMGKSAQIGLHTWLPDAMEAPTPVSALIHAATMVTAGVFLICRMSPLVELSEFARNMIIIVGSVTAFIAATIALTQRDIKRIIAYSTCSQLGYMFVATGLSAYPAAMFHLTTHAFFKALLFLGAGSVIHAMSNEQDIFKMGGLSKHIPVSYVLMWIGTLALAGIPLFAGYYSKDLILETAFASYGPYADFAWWMCEITVLLTAFYSVRLLLLTFHGNSRADDITVAHIHESPFIMLLPLFLLAIGSMFAGYLLFDFFSFEGYLVNSWQGSIIIEPQHTGFSLAHYVPEAVKYFPLLLTLAGFMLAFLIYSRGTARAEWLAVHLKPFYYLSFNKWYFDELYHRILVKPCFYVGEALWIKGDKNTIDKFGPDGIAQTIKATAKFFSSLQTGRLYHYTLAMILGIVSFITILYLLNFQ